MDLKLYEIDDGDYQTYVAATSPEEAQRIAFPPGNSAEDGLTIMEMTQELAEKVTAEEEPGEPAQSLWQMFQGVTRPSYLGWTD